MLIRPQRLPNNASAMIRDNSCNREMLSLSRITGGRKLSLAQPRLRLRP
jgi:hypothetical protein